jgi:SAM-dependent methyltransferase
MDGPEFWEEEEQVERFAARDPDRRLVALMERYDDPGATRVLDIGCAGGRNTELLASKGFDVFAIDLSHAMIQRTRERVASILGQEEAERRVQVGHMDDLSRFESDEFDLVIALGIFHAAATQEEWEGALTETARVLAPGGLLLVAVFSPRTDPRGEGIMKVPGEAHLYDGLHSGRHYLVEADDLDAAMDECGLEPVDPTDTVVVPLDQGRRVTVNGLYRKRP